MVKLALDCYSKPGNHKLEKKEEKLPNNWHAHKFSETNQSIHQVEVEWILINL